MYPNASAAHKVPHKKIQACIQMLFIVYFWYMYVSYVVLDT